MEPQISPASSFQPGDQFRFIGVTYQVEKVELQNTVVKLYTKGGRLPFVFPASQGLTRA